MNEKRPKARLPLPEVYMRFGAGKLERTGLTLIDFRLRETVQRLDLAFADVVENWIGATPPDEMRADMHKRSRKIVKGLLDSLDDELREGFYQAVVDASKGNRDDKVTPHDERAVREMFVIEADRLAKAGRKLKKAVYAEVQSKCMREKNGHRLRPFSVSTIRKVTAGIPYPPPPLRDDTEAPPTRRTAT
ncbi:hypothetical protein [Paraburkholderia youngii]|uniref:hypothetical protein n=1 Tax=Paraburkholderia youngii TaxID=2782701 RepID=UPI003D239EE3